MGFKQGVVPVRLIGQDGNAFAVLGKCARAAKEAGVPKIEIDGFFAEATNGDYDHLLGVVIGYFDVG